MYAKIWPLALFSALAGEATSFGETLPLILMLVGHTNIKKIPPVSNATISNSFAKL